MTEFRVEVLNRAAHDRQAFDCGVEPLNHYFQRQASQDVKRRIASCFVLVEQATQRVAGYYTLSAGEIARDQLPERVVKKLPRYHGLPVVRIGRLAIDQTFHGRGLGASLLFEAIERIAALPIGIVAVLVDAKDENAAAFYRHQGFIPLADEPRTFVHMIDAIMSQTSK